MDGYISRSYSISISVFVSQSCNLINVREEFDSIGLINQNECFAKYTLFARVCIGFVCVCKCESTEKYCNLISNSLNSDI